MGATFELVIIEFLIVAVFCVLLIKFYKSPMVSLDVTIAVYTSWVLGFAGILFLPYDLSLSITEGKTSETLRKVWTVVYWSTFFLAWVVLPIQMEFHSSGHFSFYTKLCDALRRLFYSLVMAIVIGIIYIIYMASSGGGSFTQILGFTMALGNTYGLIILTVLMGSGLVSFPKCLWEMADSETELLRLYITASSIEDAYQDARYELEDCELEVRKIVDLVEKDTELRTSDELKKDISLLQQKAEQFTFTSRSTTRSFVPHNSSDAGFKRVEDIDKDKLIALHSRLMLAQLNARGSERRWKVLLQQCEKHKAYVNYINKKSTYDEESLESHLNPSDSDSESEFPIKKTYSSSIRQFFDSIYWFWATKCYRYTWRFLSIICSVFSALILWSELLISSNLQSPIGLMMGAYHQQDHDESHSFLVQLVSLFALAYMSLCTYWSLFRLNFGWAYRLQGPQLSPPSSLLFNGEYFSRLQFSLGYNFLLCLNISQSNSTAFHDLMNNMNVVYVFGTSFMTYLPIVLVLVALITFFNGCGKLLSYIGFESEDSALALMPTFCCKNSEDDHELQEKLTLGKTIIRNGLKQQQLDLNVLQSREKRELIKSGDKVYEKVTVDRSINNPIFNGIKSPGKDLFELNNVTRNDSSGWNKKKDYDKLSTFSAVDLDDDKEDLFTSKQSLWTRPERKLNEFNTELIREKEEKLDRKAPRDLFSLDFSDTSANLGGRYSDL